MNRKQDADGCAQKRTEGKRQNSTHASHTLHPA